VGIVATAAFAIKENMTLMNAKCKHLKPTPSKFSSLRTKVSASGV
jgi:hypothetical protein